MTTNCVRECFLFEFEMCFTVMYMVCIAVSLWGVGLEQKENVLLRKKVVITDDPQDLFISIDYSCQVTNTLEVYIYGCKTWVTNLWNIFHACTSDTCICTCLLNANTVDWEIFALGNFALGNFHVLNFSTFYFRHLACTVLEVTASLTWEDFAI